MGQYFTYTPSLNLHNDEVISMFSDDGNEAQKDK